VLCTRSKLKDIGSRASEDVEGDIEDRDNIWRRSGSVNEVSRRLSSKKSYEIEIAR